MGARTRAGVLCSLIAAVALAAPAAATAKPKMFYGVSAAGFPAAADLQRAARGGAKSVRLTIPWRIVEPSRGMRNWRNVDEFIAAATSAGLDVLPLLSGTPAWLGPNPARAPIYSQDQRDVWYGFVRDAAARYGENGTFWALNPGIPPRPFEFWQVWNEVNLGSFWGGRPSPRDYLDLVGLTREGLRAADPGARILHAGLIPFKSASGSSLSGKKYLRALYKRKRRKRAKELIDAVAVHPYGRTPKIALKSLRQMRLTLNEAGARKTPLWVTEFGWSTGGFDWNRCPFPATLQGQAKKLRKTYKEMRKQRKMLRLRRTYYFSLSDFDQPGVADNWSTRMGLLDLNGQPKPAWFAFVERAGGTP